MVYDIVTSFEFRVARSQKSNSSGTIIEIIDPQPNLTEFYLT